MSLAVIAGAAVAAAVLSGALVVGDSVRGSLRQLTLERLGGIDQALVAQRFLPATLAAAIADSPGFEEHFTAAAPAILLRGAVEHAASHARASGVSLQGVDGRFLALYAGEGEAPALFPAGDPGPFPPVVLNAGLARAVGAGEGDQVLIHLKRWSEVPRGSLLGRKDTASVVKTLRLTVARVIDDRGLGRFGLAAHQSVPANAFVPLAALERALGQEGTVNAILLRQRPGAGAAAAEARAGELLRAALTLADLGLELRPGDGFLTLESDELVLRPAIAEAAIAAAGALGVPHQPILSYLANELRVGDRAVPYSTITAIDPVTGSPLPQLELVGGGPAPALDAGEILLGEWAAADLEAAAGDRLRLTYFEVGPREALREVSRELTVRGVVAARGPGIDPELVQEYPGIAGSDNMADWDPPFPIDLGRIRPRDEDYWDRYRDAPKAFVSLAAGQAMWRTRWGDLTALRLAAPDGDLEATGERFAGELIARLPLDGLGLAFQPVKRLGLAAATGATDFAGLFIGFSLFLIVSAALLAALLFRLGVEQRAAEVGLLLAVGYPLRAVKRQLLGEGLVLAAAGALLGGGLAVAYAGGMIHLLRTRWLPAVGTTELALHVVPATLAMGAAGSVLVVLASIYWTVRRIARVPATALIKGAIAEPGDRRPGRRARLTLALTLGPALLLLAYAVAAGETRNAGLFFAVGPLVLIGLIAAFTLLAGGELGGGGTLAGGRGAILRLAAANGGRHPGRSLLSVTLVATACFMIVTVAAFQHDYSRETLGRASGAGGYALVAESDVPLLHDPGDPDGRFALGLPEDGEDGAALAAATILSCRLLPGEDTSCLNLYRPSQPRLVGVPEAFVRRGGFTFQRTLQPAENPWTLLDLDLGEGVIPAIGDQNSMQYILKLGLGQDLEIEDQRGEAVKLRLVGTVKNSIFQSELLIGERPFLDHFPDQEGFAYFLVDAEPRAALRVARVLERGLSAYGFDAVTAGDKLAAFHAVQNTYLSTFRTLGGLGLLLGTLGLAIVLLRGVLERRGELAAMQAFGFRRTRLILMVVAENALLLLAGLAIGALAALITVAPHLLSEGAATPWGAIAGTLLTVFAAGLAAAAVAATGALRTPLLPALKAEH